MIGHADGLLLKVRKGSGFGIGTEDAFRDAEPLLEVEADPRPGFGAAPVEPAVWWRIAPGDQPWDEAHARINPDMAASRGVIAAEPDWAITWDAPRDAAKQRCQASPESDGGGRARGPHFAWHLDEACSGLRAARARVSAAAQERVLIAHLDTGYDPEHLSRPLRIEGTRERNFTGEGPRDSARDATPPSDLPLTNRGHGTATLALLAGRDPGGQPDRVTGPLGGAPGCRILPIRIADSVVRLRTSTMVQGFACALAEEADVLSMSMGGITSAALADAVNEAYRAGLVMVTAAGNYVAGAPGPRSIVYPARHRRVIAATGVMADGRAYDDLGRGTMAGCNGPPGNMDYALAGYTPNTFWAEIGCPATLDRDGQGTSAATPQIAAAAALWIARHHDRLREYPEAWMRGEAVRQALFRTARPRTAAMNEAQVRAKLGRGALDAAAALEFGPRVAAMLVKAPTADASRYLLKLLTGTGSGIAELAAGPRARMLALEMAQIAQQDEKLDALLVALDDDLPSVEKRREFLAAVRANRGASRTLRKHLTAVLDNSASRPRQMPAAPPPRPAARSPVGKRPPPPRSRRLRIFALDPSLGSSLSTYEAKIATVDVAYEIDDDENSKLRPGPVGEYLEVVDVDPSSDRFYPPVDLDDPRLLLQDGLTPSEGNPQFHQQMVYAVGMRTIANFEAALGRKALWSGHRIADGPQGFAYTQRLRIYPHALRARNAYYSPEKVALLFGYFPAESTATDRTAPGTLVFSALSADIVAHEMTHALLDGYTPGYREMTNPDVGAFHEAFADIVALLQHFQYGDLVRREIAAARGDLGVAKLLAGLALQFGEGSGKRGALRDYLNIDPEFTYRTAFAVHDRGSLLVKTVYKVFLALFQRRTADLIKLATGGSGVLADGAIHPDLVDRLTAEATKVARHVLRICIRALDYCPPVDITFGGYLRALITADLEQVDEDKYGYRTAFVEQFRRADLLPANLRTVSIETLKWNHPKEGVNVSPPWLKEALKDFDFGWRGHFPRHVIFAKARKRCKNLRGLLRRVLATDREAAGLLGLTAGLPLFDRTTGEECLRSEGTIFEVRTVRAAQRQRPDGEISDEIIVVLTQRRPVMKDDQVSFWFRGGSTVVIDPGDGARREPKIRYVITKPLSSEGRLARETEFRNDPPIQRPNSLYFGGADLGREPFAALHALEDEA